VTYDQLPPHDIAAEEAVVASLMVDPDLVHKIAPMIEPRDFFREANAWTYEACIALADRGEPINQVTVAHELDQRGRLEDAGGLTYLSELILNLPTPVGAEHYAAIVKRCAVYRQLISAAGAISQLAYKAPADVAGVLAQADALLQGLQAPGAERDWRPLRDLLEPLLDPPEDTRPGQGGGGLRTGLMELDRIIVGTRPGDLMIVAARTGVGKTALMLNLARNAAAGQSAKVGIFSLEMSAEQMAQRLLSAEARVDSRRLRISMHNETEEMRVMHAWGVLAGLPVYLDDSRPLRLSELRSRAKRLQRDHGLDLLIVDYLQLVQGSRERDNRVQEVSEVTRGLKMLAGELGVPIVAGAQLSRATEQRAGHLPLLSDLRESGSIEQDADLVVFIHREAAHTTREQWESQHPDRHKDPYPEGLAELIVAKNRHGPTGTVTTRFHAGWALFEAIDDVVERQAALV
jgi:replicative DNA helicase